MTALRQAVEIAAAYASDQGPTRCAILHPGVIRATTSHERGCEIPCPAIQVRCAVHADSLLKMIKSCGKGKIELKLVKGRKLQIKGGGVTYKLQAIPEKDEPGSLVPPPRLHWVKVPEPVVASLARLEAFCDPRRAPSPGTAGVRLTSRWAATFGGQARMAVLWVNGLVTFSVTIPPGFWSAVTGEVELGVHNGNAWLRTPEGEIRWSRMLAGEFPDGALETLITSARGDHGRVVTKVDAKRLAALCRRAEAITRAPADGFKLQLTPSLVKIEGHVHSGPYGAQDFEGEIEASAKGTSEVGILPKAFRQLSDVVGTSEDGEVCLSVAGPSRPVLLWGGAPIIEAVTTPVVLLGGDP